MRTPPAFVAMSLRGQVTAMFAVGAFIVSLILGVTTAVVVQPLMLEQRERATQRQVALNVDVIDHVMSSAPDALAETLRSLDRPITSVSLVRFDGRWYTSRVDADPTDLPAVVGAATAAGQSITVRAQVAGQPVLAAVRPVAGQAVYVEVFSLADIAQTEQMIVLVLIGVGTITTLLGAVIGRWAAGAAVQPITGLTHAAAAVAAGDLSVSMPPGRAADLRALADGFNRTVAALRRRVDHDARFAADVSHELRTPLTTMVNAVELLRTTPDTLSPTTREVIDLLTEEVHRFERTVLDLLEISTAPNTSFVVEPVAFGDLVRGVADRMIGRPVTKVRHEAVGLVVSGDRRRLERVVTNLVENSERHGGGVAVITVSTNRDVARMEVDDEGPGVPADQHERVFERFGRAHSGPRGSGAGLGLAIVAEHVRRHAGRIWVENRPGGGARFVVELPVSPAAAQALPPAHRVEHR